VLAGSGGAALGRGGSSLLWSTCGERKVSTAVADRDNTAARCHLTGKKRRAAASDRLQSPGDFYMRQTAVGRCHPGRKIRARRRATLSLAGGPHLVMTFPFSNIPEIGFPHEKNI
jgi:hypothetical protein